MLLHLVLDASNEDSFRVLFNSSFKILSHLFLEISTRNKLCYSRRLFDCLLANTIKRNDRIFNRKRNMPQPKRDSLLLYTSKDEDHQYNNSKNAKNVTSPTSNTSSSDAYAVDVNQMEYKKAQQQQQQQGHVVKAEFRDDDDFDVDANDSVDDDAVDKSKENEELKQQIHSIQKERQNMGETFEMELENLTLKIEKLYKSKATLQHYCDDMEEKILDDRQRQLVQGLEK